MTGQLALDKLVAILCLDVGMKQAVFARLPLHVFIVEAAILPKMLDVMWKRPDISRRCATGDPKQDQGASKKKDRPQHCSTVGNYVLCAAVGARSWAQCHRSAGRVWDGMSGLTNESGVDLD